MPDELMRRLAWMEREINNLKVFDVPRKQNLPLTYFLHNDPADVATYEKLLGTPAGGAEDTDSQVCATPGTEYLLGSYITYPTTGLGVEVLLGGVWYFDTYLSIDSDVGDSRVVIRVYKRAADTTETQLFTLTTNELSGATANLYETSITVADIVLAVTDRLVVKYYAKTTSVPNRTVTLYYEGTTHYSHIHTPVSIASSGITQQQFIPLTAALTSTSWDGDSFSTTAKTLIDLSAVFGVPAGVKAIYLRAVIRDSGSAGNTDIYLVLGPTNAGGAGLNVRCGGRPNDFWEDQTIIVPCDANGDVYYQIVASGGSTMDVYLFIWGYWIGG